MLPFTDDLQRKQSTSQPSVKTARVIRRVQCKGKLTREYTEMRTLSSAQTEKAITALYWIKCDFYCPLDSLTFNVQTPINYLSVD